MAAVVNEITR